MNFEQIIQGGSFALLAIGILAAGRWLGQLGTKLSSAIIDMINGLKESQEALLESQRAQNVDHIRRASESMQHNERLAMMNRHKVATDLTTVQANLLHAIERTRRDVIGEFRRERNVDIEKPVADVIELPKDDPVHERLPSGRERGESVSGREGGGGGGRYREISTAGGGLSGGGAGAGFWDREEEGD